MQLNAWRSPAEDRNLPKLGVITAPWADGLGSVVGNKKTEQTAITHVMALERAAGRDPKDVHASGLPYDIESAPRMI